MAFDDRTRNRLQRFVSDARALLFEEFTRQMQHEYGMDPTSGEVADLDRLSHMDNTRRETACLLRDTLAHYLATTPSGGKQEALQRILREQAFTVLNRLAALRMMESRGFLIESIARGYQSKGFQLYQRLAGSALGETGDAYRHYLFSLFDEFALDLAVLFDRFSPQGRLFPREMALQGLLELINHPEIEPLWAEDETIGWIYQYFNSQEERRQMRADSSAPRNSRELAVRNQFFTPRYVVEFLTDNTLGRIWYEMSRGTTALKDQCRYLVHRPHEIFLGPGEAIPQQEEHQQDLGQEELVQQRVYIPFRAIKDPRDITMLDPACGSMHFGLYAFDLYEKMYDEAWELENQIGAAGCTRIHGLKSLREAYATKEDFLCDVPRLIIERNIHGIDIDPRAVQIAGLSLWLRAQKSWQAQGIKPQDRPQIQRSNIVCAEPMPGDGNMIEEFLKSLRNIRLESLIRRVLNVSENQQIRATQKMAEALCDLVRTVWKEMELAGEAGSLLKIEEALTDAIAKGKAEWEEKAPLFRVTEFGLTEQQPKISYYKSIPGAEEDFWNRAESLVMAALKDYAEHTETVEATRKRLFAQDAARGFAFIDVWRQRFDVVLMNPPFGEPCGRTRQYLYDAYSHATVDIFASFIERMVNIARFVGVITSRTGFFLATFEDWRRELPYDKSPLITFADLGDGVLDAMVEAAAYCLAREQASAPVFFRLIESNEKSLSLLQRVRALANAEHVEGIFVRKCSEFMSLPGSPCAYWMQPELARAHQRLPSLQKEWGELVRGPEVEDLWRDVRCWWEVDAREIGIDKRWIWYAKGGEFKRFSSDVHLVVDYGGVRQRTRRFRRPGDQDYYFRPGITYSQRTTSPISFRVLPAGCLTSPKGPAIIPHRRIDDLLPLLAICNSATFARLVELRVGAAGAAARSYDLGILRAVPMPPRSSAEIETLAQLAGEALSLSQEWAADDECDITFSRLLWSSNRLRSLNEIAVLRRRQLEERANSLNRTMEEIERVVLSAFGSRNTGRSTEPADPGRHLPKDLLRETAEGVVSIALGVVFGRWDLRYMTTQGEEQREDYFEALAGCSPAMLKTKNETDLLQHPETPRDRLLRISWDGVLVDDQVNSEDIVQRIRDVLTALWGERCDAIEEQVCEYLAANSLREYLSSTRKFFTDHLKRYSKSHRVAPIYWPISIPSGSYTLWLYYLRLTDQTLYTCVNDFIDPKLKQLSEKAVQLRQKTHRSNAEERDLEQLLEFEQELKDFRNELLRVAGFWKPNLNDGVQITAAPLWKLFQHRLWQKTLKDTWEKLEDGDYDWAHLAYSIWPDRVREKCRHDKSLAIAHGLADLYEVPPEQPRNKRGRTRG